MMRLLPVWALCLGLAAAPVTARIGGGDLTGEEIRASLVGATLDGIYQGGLAWSETYRADGTLAYADQVRAMTGRWTLKGGTFCTRYDRASDGGCFTLRQTSGNCFEFRAAREPSKSAAPPASAAPWVAQGWRREKPSTCSKGEAV